MASKRPPARPLRGYRIELKPAAARELAALGQKDRVRVGKKIDALAANPRPPGAEKLKGTDDLWRVRVGDYRIVYAIQDAAPLSPHFGAPCSGSARWFAPGETTSLPT